jgi:hypothetical protein
MRSTTSFVTTSLAGTVLALMISPGAAPSLSPIGRDVANSYRSAVRVYDKAREWGLIARWWIDPEWAPSGRDARTDPKLDDVCQARPAAKRQRGAGRSLVSLRAERLRVPSGRR